MSFGYSDSLTIPADQIRFHIGDTIEAAGPRPDRRNYSDNEIAYFLASEDDRVNGAVALAFETLAGEWTAFALSEREGNVSMDATGVANQYRTQAQAWRRKPGGSSIANRGRVVVGLTREDAYTDD